MLPSRLMTVECRDAEQNGTIRTSFPFAVQDGVVHQTRIEAHGPEMTDRRSAEAPRPRNSSVPSCRPTQGKG